MASPVFESIASDTITDDVDTAFVITKPSGLAVGDTLLAIFGMTDGRTVSPATGTYTTEGNDTDGGLRIMVFRKIADSTDAAATDFTWNLSGGFANGARGAMLRISGADDASLIDSYSTGPNDTSQTCPTIDTTGFADTLAIWGVYIGGTQTFTADKGTERLDGGIGFALYTSAVAAAGSTTGAVITSSGFGAKRVFSLAVKSPAGGGGSAVGTGLTQSPKLQRLSLVA